MNNHKLTVFKTITYIFWYRKHLCHTILIINRISLRLNALLSSILITATAPIYFNELSDPQNVFVGDYYVFCFVLFCLFVFCLFLRKYTLVMQPVSLKWGKVSRCTWSNWCDGYNPPAKTGITGIRYIAAMKS